LQTFLAQHLVLEQLIATIKCQPHHGKRSHRGYTECG
jgi:hypothetical protein